MALATLFLVVVGFLAASAAAGDAQSRPAQSPGTDCEAPCDTDGHERMKALLAKIGRQQPHELQFEGKLGQIRRNLEELPADAPPTQRVSIQGALAQAELQAGNVARAIELFEQVLQLLPQVPEETRMRFVVPALWSLGVAQLRTAQTVNCVEDHRVEDCILPIVPGAIHRDPAPGRAAVLYFAELMSFTPPQHPINIAAKWLLNMTAMMLGDYPSRLPEALRIDTDVFVSATQFPRFANVSLQAGLATYGYAGGAVVDDLDGDGLLDVVTSSLDPNTQLRVFRNEGTGKFADITEAAGLLGILGGLNLESNDYDNDGDLDILVLRGAWQRELGRWPNSLLRNNGDLTFTDVTFDAGLGEVHYPTQTAAWADYDNDGDLDLYIANESLGDEGYVSQLFRNEGNGTFVDVAEQAGVQNLRYSKGATWGDYNDDGFADLYISNYADINRLYRNNRDGTFTDVAEQLGVTGPIESFVAWFWDVNNDGALDLLVNSYQRSTAGSAPTIWYVAAGYMGLPHPAPAPALYLGDGNGGFVDAATAYGIAESTLPMGANYGDLDNDGWLDYYLGTGYPGYDGLMPNVMYRNAGGDRFDNVTYAGGFGHLAKGHAIAFADIDNDGDQDIFQQMGGFYPADQYFDVLYRNPGFGNHWISIKLVGTRGNRAAMGARIRVDITEARRQRSVYRTVGTGASFGGNPLRAEIGLGRAERIDKLEIRWPASGTTQTFHDVAVDRFVEITEGTDAIRELVLPTFPLPGAQHQP